MGKCKDCRFWRRTTLAPKPPYGKNKLVEGVCERIVFVEEEGGDTALACIESDGSHYGVYLMTAPHHGCHEHRPKE